MEPIRIILSGSWVCVMLTYLLGDVLRIFAGDVVPGEIQGMEASQVMWMIAAVVMLIPILMVFLTLVVPYPVIRWVNIGAAAFLILFNLLGLPYDSAFDNFLIVVSIVFNGVTIGYAVGWVG
ncbi:MAG: hypothetical protein GYB64_12915 [Chloroflexi bacterium]|nr:hypothetical protein [Chloroflexota bacterium]